MFPAGPAHFEQTSKHVQSQCLENTQIIVYHEPAEELLSTTSSHTHTHTLSLSLGLFILPQTLCFCPFVSLLPLNPFLLLPVSLHLPVVYQ